MPFFLIFTKSKIAQFVSILNHRENWRMSPWAPSIHWIRQIKPSSPFSVPKLSEPRLLRYGQWWQIAKWICFAPNSISYKRHILRCFRETWAVVKHRLDKTIPPNALSLLTYCRGMHLTRHMVTCHSTIKKLNSEIRPGFCSSATIQK
jgi:hypothetical protein